MGTKIKHNITTTCFCGLCYYQRVIINVIFVMCIARFGWKIWKWYIGTERFKCDPVCMALRCGVCVFVDADRYDVKSHSMSLWWWKLATMLNCTYIPQCHISITTDVYRPRHICSRNGSVLWNSIIRLYISLPITCNFSVVYCTVGSNDGFCFV